MKFKLTPPLLKRLAFAAMDVCRSAGYTDVSLHVTGNTITYMAWTERGKSETTYANSKELDGLASQIRKRRGMVATPWA